MEGFIIKDIDAAPSVHEYLGEFIPSHLRCNHQCQMTRIINPGRMILSTPPNGLLKPAQVMGYGRFNGVYCPFMKLLIPFAQTRGEEVVLPTIQLFRVTLIPRLLLLTPRTGLLMKTSLVTLATLVTLQTRVRAATTMIQNIRTET